MQRNPVSYQIEMFAWYNFDDKKAIQRRVYHRNALTMHMLSSNHYYKNNMVRGMQNFRLILYLYERGILSGYKLEACPNAFIYFLFGYQRHFINFIDHSFTRIY